MNDDRDGLDLLVRTIDEVAESLPETGRSNAARGRRPSGARFAVVAAAVLVMAAGLTATFWWADRDQTPVAVEVLVLRVDGRDVSARVIETAGNGTIVVVPAIEQSQREARANDRLVAWATIGGLR